MLDPSEVEASELRPMDRHQYRQLWGLGFWNKERVELLEGVVVRMSPTGWSHTKLHGLLLTFIARSLPKDLLVTAGSSFVASRFSEPMPDIAVVRRREIDKHLPSKALLVVEVAQSSLRKDLGVKARIYANARIREYWVVNTKKLTIEVHRNPSRGRYRSVTTYDRKARVQPLLLPDITVCLDELLK